MIAVDERPQAIYSFLMLLSNAIELYLRVGIFPIDTIICSGHMQLGVKEFVQVVLSTLTCEHACDEISSNINVIFGQRSSIHGSFTTSREFLRDFDPTLAYFLPRDIMASVDEPD